jgi:plasmid stabilization system protein ParE
MAAKITISANVYTEIEQIIDWYNDKSDVAATNFLEEVNHFILKIARNPELYAIVINQFRQCKMKVFPYYIIYRYYALSHKIVIHKIIHVKRRMDKRFE